MSDLVQKLVEELEYLIDLADSAMRQANNDGAEYERDEMLAAPRAALSAAKDGGWQPIETAPKDGRRVLVWIDDKHLAREQRQVNFAKLWFYEDGRLGGGAEGFNGKWDITHWQPLPNPPKEQA